MVGMEGRFKSEGIYVCIQLIHTAAAESNITL